MTISLIQDKDGAELNLHALTAKLGGREILRGIDLQVQPGEFVSIVGRSGSGKSTLLRVLAGLEPPASGVLRVGAQPIVMFQEPRLLPWRSVLQNISLGLATPDTKHALQVLEQVGLADRAHDYPSTLSGGQRQRVALARALMHRPDVLLLDEPFGALDALTRISAQKLVESLWRELGFTAVLVTHDVDEAVLLGDHVLVLDEGRVVYREHVALPRPRARNSAEVGRIAGRVLEAIFDTPVRVPAPDPAPVPEVATKLWQTVHRTHLVPGETP
jgi:sulfonate transport system ATP-binding protein